MSMPEIKKPIEPFIDGECHCLRCGYDWTAKSGVKPKVCTRCKSYVWDKDPQDVGGFGPSAKKS